MDQSKVENFLKAYPGESFPKFRSLSAAECAEVRRGVLALLQLQSNASGLEMVKALYRRDGSQLGEVPLGMPIALRDVLRGVPLRSHHPVFVNWHQFDHIDVLDLDDLSLHFDDIWYPSVDDIEIFDESKSWFLCVSHDGRLTLREPLLRRNQDGPSRIPTKNAE